MHSSKRRLQLDRAEWPTHDLTGLLMSLVHLPSLDGYSCVQATNERRMRSVPTKVQKGIEFLGRTGV